MHEFNSYVTLTYDRDNLPENGFLSRRDTQLFMKRLRKVRPPRSVRVYGSGEYGDLNKRPHYHLLLFGVQFAGLKRYKEVKEVVHYQSDELRELWALGNHDIVPSINFESASYVAGYVHKKINGALADSHYEVYDADGLIHRRPSEFAIHSRGSAIGKAYYEKFGAEIRAHDTVIVNGRAVRPPRVYDIWSEAFEPPPAEGLTDTRLFTKHKRRRKAVALTLRSDNTSRRRLVKELVSKARMKKRLL